jgi:hypothetical protein
MKLWLCYSCNVSNGFEYRLMHNHLVRRPVLEDGNISQRLSYVVLYTVIRVPVVGFPGI